MLLFQLVGLIFYMFVCPKLSLKLCEEPEVIENYHNSTQSRSWSMQLGYAVQYKIRERVGKFTTTFSDC